MSRQDWRYGQKKSQPQMVGILSSGGVRGSERLRFVRSGWSIFVKK
ncbi:hypothetical protein FHW67_000893 [Herbaspirillum sp. Sphag1AN]|nr:hypothetical protein [Herbaspirillum sp. Sphag1AN]MBB3245087.1 hypothetical protein [Herbaspirillum sp. Sphag64]